MSVAYEVFPEDFLEKKPVVNEETKKEKELFAKILEKDIKENFPLKTLEESKKNEKNN